MGDVRLDVSCPACGDERPRQSRFAHCGACGHRWLVSSAAEREAIEQSYYTDHYDGYRDDPRFEAAIRAALTELVASRVAPPARFLDIGCGAGDLLVAAIELGYAAEGIDVSQAGAEICRTKGLTAVAADFLTHDFGGGFDVITMWDVVEHLREPERFFARARALLNPRGIFVGKLPGFGGLSVEIGKRVPRAAGILLGAPDHIQYFNIASLERLGERAGFRIEQVTGPAEMRTPARGGSLKRRFGRVAARTINRLSGDANLYFVATPA